MRPNTHLTVLQNSVTIHGSAPVFRLPAIAAETGAVSEWQTITYSQFQADVEHFAKYWIAALAVQNIELGSVVGLW